MMGTEMLNFIDMYYFQKEINQIKENIIEEINTKNELEIMLRFKELKLCLAKQFWINDDLGRKNDAH